MNNHSLIIAIIAALLATSCGQKTAPADKPFTFARVADAQKLDPAAADDSESVKVLNNICEGLVRFKSGTTQIEPCLAETWNLSSDARTCIIALREGVKFHDGTPLNAAAVAWNFNRQMDASAPGHLPNANSANGSTFYNDIETVRVLDAQRMEFRLKKPNAALLPNLATPSAYLISPRAFADYGEGLSRHPVGTGPFKLREWLPNERIVLETNPDYWGQKPKSDRVVFKVVPNSSARFIQLQAGQVHAMDGLDPNDLASVRADRNMKLVEVPGINLAFLAFNCRKPPMDRLEFRQAVALAIQKPPFIESVYRGAAVAANSVLPLALRGPNANLEDWPCDIERARNLIAQLQIVLKPVTVSTNDAFGLPITITTNVIERIELPTLALHVMTTPRPYLPNPMRAAELIKADLESIGLKIQLVHQNPAAHLAAVRNGEHALALHGCIGRNGDPGSFLGIIDPEVGRSATGINISFLEDYQLAAALNDGREQLDPEKRARAYLRASALAHERLPIIPLAYAHDIVVLRQEVRDFVLQPTLELRLSPVWLK
ncbi:MAG: ABC transporter substrate-binding protein [Verrucomicrobia bacterium]|nr:ABC transporter substrate-binding protein [Verrucomicrobiota bacterium]